MKCITYIYKIVASVVLLLLFSPVSAQVMERGHVLDSAMVVADMPRISSGNEWTVLPDVAGRFTSVAGVADPVRFLGTLPGVSQGIEGTSAFYVRGSNLSGNRIEMSGVPVYSSSHLLGLVSSFDIDMISSTSFKSGGLPASSGNATSSLTSLELRHGNVASEAGSISLSPYISGFHIAVPKRDSKLNWRMSARASAFPYLGNLALSEVSARTVSDLRSTGGFSYDVMSTLDWFEEFFSVQLMLFSTMDKLQYSTDKRWSDMNGSEHIAMASITGPVGRTGHLTARSYVNCHSSSDIQTYGQLSSTHGLTPRIEEILNRGDSNLEASVQVKLDGQIIRNVMYETGAEVLYDHYGLETGHQNGADGMPATKHNDTHSTDVSAFGTLTASFADRLETKFGLRPTFHISDGATLFDCDIHTMADLLLTKHTTLEVSYDRAAQYYHLLEGLPVGWGQDLRVAATADFPQEMVNQTYAGVSFSMGGRERGIFVNGSLGAYYKTMTNLVSYISAENMFGVSNIEWEDDVTVGEGTSKGLELSLTIKGGRFDVTAAYTLSKTDRTYAELNFGQTFPFRFDRRHIANVRIDVLTVDKGPNTQHLVLTGNYSSGNHITVPLSEYEGIELPMWTTLAGRDREFPSVTDDYFKHIPEVNGINNAHVPDYFRIDLAYSFRFPGNELSFSVYNLLNRHNPYQIFYEDGKWKQLSLFPIMPSVSWKRTF